MGWREQRQVITEAEDGSQWIGEFEGDALDLFTNCPDPDIWLPKASETPTEYRKALDREATKALKTGLTDAHMWLPFKGERPPEYRKRLQRQATEVLDFEGRTRRGAPPKHRSRDVQAWYLSKAGLPWAEIARRGKFGNWRTAKKAVQRLESRILIVTDYGILLDG